MISFRIGSGTGGPFGFIRSYRYGFFCNVFDHTIEDSVSVVDLWTRPQFDEAIVNGYIFNTLDVFDFPPSFPEWAKPNKTSPILTPQYLDCPEKEFTAKYFAEETPTYPIVDIIAEENGITYYESDYQHVYAKGLNYGEFSVSVDTTVEVPHGISEFTGYGTHPPEECLANWGLKAIFKYPVLFEEPESDPPLIVLASFLFNGNTGDPFSDHIDFYNNEGLWHTEVNDSLATGFIILHTWQYGTNTTCLYEGYNLGTLVENDVLRLTRKVPGEFGIGIGFNPNREPKDRRFLVKDLKTNTILEDINVSDWNTVASAYVDIDVLSSSTAAVTLEQTPAYYDFTNDSDDTFADNTWEGRVMREHVNEIIIRNTPNQGWVGDF